LNIAIAWRTSVCAVAVGDARVCLVAVCVGHSLVGLRVGLVEESVADRDLLWLVLDHFLVGFEVL